MKAFSIEFINAAAETRHAVLDFVHCWQDERTYVETRTSGSTGMPKTIRIPKKRMEASAKLTDSRLGLHELNSALLCLNPQTIAGKMMLVRAILFDLKLYVAEPERNPLQHLSEPVDFTALVPLQLDAVLTENPAILRKIPAVIVGGGVISGSIRSKMQELSIGVYETFGMTETTSHVALRKTGINSEINFEMLGKGWVSQTSDGCLVIHSPELEIESLETNDLVRITGSRHFEFLGRKDFVINSGGVKIHPELLERKLEPEISEPFFITGLPDEQLGEQVVLFIERASRNNRLLTFENLDRYEKPRQVFYLNSFVRTASGKINRPETVKLLVSQ